eukprot:scaffold74075_cov31-Tisochrysis_lutea.AAC.2
MNEQMNAELTCWRGSQLATPPTPTTLLTCFCKQSHLRTWRRLLRLGDAQHFHCLALCFKVALDIHGRGALAALCGQQANLVTTT